MKGKVNTMIAQTYRALNNQMIASNLFRRICDDMIDGKDIVPWTEDHKTYETLKVKNSKGKVLSFKVTDKVDGLLLYGHTFEPLNFERAYEIIKVRLY